MAQSSPGYMREYWSQHKDELNRKRRERYARNSSDRLAANRRYKEANREKLKVSNQQYRQENAESIRSALIAKKAMRKRAMDEMFTEGELLARWGKSCHLCGEEINLNAPRGAGVVGWELGLHVDHVIPISRGGRHSLDNCKPSHGICNVRKGARYLGSKLDPC